MQKTYSRIKGIDYVILAELRPVLLICSLVPYGAFAYVGYYTFERFKFYADIAERIKDQGLLTYAKLDEATTSITGEEVTIDVYILNQVKKQKKSFFRSRILTHFRIFYWILVSLLGISVIFPS